jgi:hypothetical protein
MNYILLNAKEGAMYQTMKVFKRVLVANLMLLMPVFMAANSGLAMDMEAGHDMSSHHQHIMLNHALGMTLEGYNLVMLGGMGMARGVDEVSVEHGNVMIKNGKAMWNEIMSGKIMTGMHHSGKDPMKDPAMAYTHKLAEKQLKVIDLLGKMPESEMAPGSASHDMSMHHRMAKGVDEISVDHGRMMLKNARSLFNDIMSGKDMMDMHKAGTSPESDERMKYTHRLTEAQLQVLTLLDDMPAMGK